MLKKKECTVFLVVMASPMMKIRVKTRRKIRMKKPGLDIYDCPVKARVRLLCRLLLKTTVAATAEK